MLEKQEGMIRWSKRVDDYLISFWCIYDYNCFSGEKLSHLSLILQIDFNY